MIRLLTRSTIFWLEVLIVRHGIVLKRGRLASAALAFAFIAMSQWAQGECLSPSAEVGATATTVYRCSEETLPSAKQPLLPGPEKTTTVERGSAEVPWFEPAPQKTVIKPAKASPEIPAAASAPEKTDIETAKATPETDTEVQAVPESDTQEQAAPKRERPKAKAKLPAKKKVAAKKKKKKVRIAKSQKSKVKAVEQPAPATAEAKPADDKTIVWTKKDMSLGSRITNWLGL